jgi:MSHA biogenesis protein MshQ
MPASVTAAAWIYPRTTPSYSARVIAKGVDSGDAEAYYLQFDGSLSWAVRDLNHENHSVSGPDVGLNEWTHVAATYEPNTLQIYVNGELAAEDSNGPAAMLQDTNDLSIGNRGDANNRVFEGRMDDVRIYDYALSDTEVAYVATNGSGYLPLDSIANLYDSEPLGQKAVNFKDYAVLMASWLEEKLWPE